MGPLIRFRVGDDRLESFLQSAWVIALIDEPLEDSGVRIPVHLWRSAEDPQVFATGHADDGPPVVGIQIDDPVRAPEGTEERDLEFGVALGIDNLGLAIGLFEFAG